MSLPNFHLYGEGESRFEAGFVHIETIASRSRRNDWEIKPHSHDTLDQLLVLRRGEVVAGIEGDRASRPAPVLIHVPAGTVHGFSFSDDVDGDVVTFSSEFRARLLTGQGREAILIEGVAILALDAAQLARLEPILGELRTECSGDAPGAVAASGWLLGLMLHHAARVAAARRSPLAADERLVRFRALADRHFRDHRPVAFYAAELGMTERSLTRLSRAHLGCAPAHYLHRRLLLEARRHLAYGNQPISHIADELGFADPSYFSRFYRRMTGSAPSAGRPDRRLP